MAISCLFTACDLQQLGRTIHMLINQDYARQHLQEQSVRLASTTVTLKLYLQDCLAICIYMAQ